MDPPFRIYTRQVSYVKAVCACLRHATPKEKQAVAQELQDHLADHADALVEAGWDPEEAQAHALDAMGDAQEVGQALNREFPLRWLVISRVAGCVFLIALCVFLIALLLASSWLREPVMDLYYYHQAKYDPLSFDWHRDELPTMAPLDLQAALPGGATLSIYAMGITENDTGSYDAYVCAVSYGENPFQFPTDAAQYLTFSAGGEEIFSYSPIGDTRSSCCFALYHLPELSWGVVPTAQLARNGTHVTWEIPLPWQEVSP